MNQKVRILIAKPGLDGHDRGAKVVAYALRDAGFEVIYLGLRQTPEQIVTTAIQESVDVIGLSILSGAHLPLTHKVLAKLKEKGGEGICVIVGGVIPEDDVQSLRDMGVKEVFTSRTGIEAIIETIKEDTRMRRRRDERGGEGLG